MIHVAHLAPRGCWDENILTQLLGNHLHPTGLEYEHHDGWPNIYDTGVIAIIPGRYWHTRAAEISEAMARYRWVLAFRTGDEEDLFDIDAVTHPNIKWWVQTPRADKYYRGARWFGVGWTPAFNNPPFDPGTPAARKRPLDVYLAGQNTHCRRNQAFKTLNTMQEHPDYRKIRIQADPTPDLRKVSAPRSTPKLWLPRRLVWPRPAQSPPTVSDSGKRYKHTPCRSLTVNHRCKAIMRHSFGHACSAMAAHYQSSQPMRNYQAILRICLPGGRRTETA